MNRNFKISPLEGLPLLPICIVLLVVFAALGMVLSGILSIISWILFAPFAFFLISMLYLRLSHKWAGVHYPVMVRYSRMVGMAMGLYPNKEVDERVDIALTFLLHSLYPNLSDEAIKKLFQEITDKDNVFLDKEIIVKVLERKTPNKSHEENEKMATKLLDSYKEGAENSLKVSHVISELIKYKYGEIEQLEYIFAVMSGRAK